MTQEHTNDLIHESSPYLLQHAHNPVNWKAWRPEVIQQAIEENKLLIISIGYAACHWCHVMEEECFEDEEVAVTMNDNFINIKVDREERPDIDHIYMDALQMMSGHGGWPLNIVALPDGKPFWGATYVKKDQWIRVLDQIAEIYSKEPNKLVSYAEDLAKGIKQINLIENEPAGSILELDELTAVVNRWSRHFDNQRGGYNRAPKFMMPGNLDFLLHYYFTTRDENILKYLHLTLTKMAYGGVFDHLAGGFARYSVDNKWHVPHFEKMLYDNAQLCSLYAKAYGLDKNPLYAKVVKEIIAFATSELMNVNAGFYSSLDADSTNEQGELEEGAYYVWTEKELKDALGDGFELFKDYYNINSYGHWEHGNYVLIRDQSSAELAKKHKISVDELNISIDLSKEILFELRNKRDRPRLDDKILCSWNGLMLKGLTDAYRYLQDPEYLDLAVKNAQFIESAFIQENAELLHNHKDGKSSIRGYLEDYASVIDGYIGLYEVSFEEKWLYLAKRLAGHCLEEYYDNSSGLFFFNSSKDDLLIRRTIETGDNVIPASNSIMCKNLIKLSKIFLQDNFGEIADRMIAKMQERMVKYPESHANWLHSILYSTQPFYEVAVVGMEQENLRKTMQTTYQPNAIYAGTDKESDLDLLQNRTKKGETLIYICVQGACQLPVSSAKEAFDQMRRND